MNTVSGSAAGTPLADLMYVIAMSKVMQKLRNDIEIENLIEVVNMNGIDVKVHEVGYVDDSAIFVFSDATNLVRLTCRVATIAMRVFTQYAMELNWKPGKSEVLPVWRGPGCKKEQRKLELDLNSSVPCTSGNFHFILRFVRNYKHLGTLFDANGDVKSEVATKAAIMKSESSKLRSRVFANPGISTKKK